MAFAMTKVSYSGKIMEVILGQGDKALTVGGESAYPFHTFEGVMPRKPVLAMEVWDMTPTDWPVACSAPVADVMSDPGAWAKKCVEEYGAEAIVLQLKSTDPNGLDAPPEKASEAVGKVLAAVKVPLIVWGSANPGKDAESFKKIAEDYQGKSLLLGPVSEDNHKAVGAAALAYKHSLIASSPIDVNLAKQLNILLSNLGVPLTNIVIDPTTGGLGYGMEYSYSVMERIRMAALVQDDDKLMLPLINNVGNEVWKCKEAKLSNEEAPELGDAMKRGVLMETTAAISFLMAGSDILILRHPQTLQRVKNFMAKMAAPRAAAAAKVKVDRPTAAPVTAAAATVKVDRPTAAPVAIIAPVAIAAAKPAATAVPVVDAAVPVVDAAAEAKAETVARAAIEAAAKAKAEATARAVIEAAAKAKAEATARAAIEAVAEAKAREDKKLKEIAELNALRVKRAAEAIARASAHACTPTRKEGINYGKGREAGTAGSDASYIYSSLERWALRGPGFLK
ncbi:acetyl-CoA decarbonylase/synthase, CODH/ACS complex subunit delta [Desulfarculales bacterium]